MGKRARRHSNARLLAPEARSARPSATSARRESTTYIFGRQSPPVRHVAGTRTARETDDVPLQPSVPLVASRFAEGCQGLCQMKRAISVIVLLSCGSPSGPPTLTLSLENHAMRVGETVTLIATVRDAGGERVSDPAITWRSTDVDLATVSSTGVVTAIEGGAVSIHATYEGLTATTALTITTVAAGSWSGSTDRQTFNMVLEEAPNGAVTGSGTGMQNGVTTAMTVSGSHAHPSISFTMEMQGFQDINFSGAFTTNHRIAGNINGSGFNNIRLTLNRSR